MSRGTRVAGACAARLALIHFPWRFVSGFRRLAAGQSVPPGAAIQADFVGVGPTLGMQASRYRAVSEIVSCPDRS